MDKAYNIPPTMAIPNAATVSNPLLANMLVRSCRVTYLDCLTALEDKDREGGKELGMQD